MFSFIMLKQKYWDCIICIQIYMCCCKMMKFHFFSALPHIGHVTIRPTPE